jgi:hypothetical protein
MHKEVRLDELQRLPELAPGLLRLACHVDLDLRPSALFAELALEELTLNSASMESDLENGAEVARIWAIPWISLKLALSSNVKLEQPFRGRRLDFFCCEGPFVPLLEGAPLIHLATAGAKIRELVMWPGFARIPRLGLYTVPPSELARLASVRLDGLRDLEIDLEPGELGGRELAAIRTAPWAKALRSSAARGRGRRRARQAGPEPAAADDARSDRARGRRDPADPRGGGSAPRARRQRAPGLHARLDGVRAHLKASTAGRTSTVQLRRWSCVKRSRA